MDIVGNKENRVPLNNNTVNKCICSMCPVQTGSACSTAKMKKLKDSIKMSLPSTSVGSGIMGSMFIQEDINMQEAKLPEPREIPAVYCSIDKAACSDLNINKGCICTDCQNYRDYSLAAGRPVEHYCFNGRAE